MTHEQSLIDDEPALPSSYLRGGPATTGELWALDRWRQERRWRSQPWSRIFNRVAPSLFFTMGIFGLATGRGTFNRINPPIAVLLIVVGVLMPVLMNFERQGYIRLLERYAAELEKLRGDNRAPLP